MGPSLVNDLDLLMLSKPSFATDNNDNDDVSSFIGPFPSFYDDDDIEIVDCCHSSTCSTTVCSSSQDSRHINSSNCIRRLSFESSSYEGSDLGKGLLSNGTCTTTTTNNVQVVVRIRSPGTPGSTNTDNKTKSTNDSFDINLANDHHDHHHDGRSLDTQYMHILTYPPESFDDSDTDQARKAGRETLSTIQVNRPGTNGNQQAYKHRKGRGGSKTTTMTTTTTNGLCQKNYRYTFDRVFDPSTTQSELYDMCNISSMIHDGITNGHNGTIFSYGQTGSGKTFTLLGPSVSFTATANDDDYLLSRRSTNGTGVNGRHRSLTVDNSVDSGETSNTAYSSMERDSTHRHRNSSSRHSIVKRCDSSKHNNTSGRRGLLSGSDLQQSSSNANRNIQKCTNTVDITGNDRGIIPRALECVFNALNLDKEKEGNSNLDTSRVSITLLELYGENLRDLLSLSTTAPNQKHQLHSSLHCQGDKGLIIRDCTDHSYGSCIDCEVVGATQLTVTTVEDGLRVLNEGLAHRSTRSTEMNECSSRSHVILTVFVERTLLCSDVNGVEQSQHCISKIKKSKFNFVDLAGSERQKRTSSVGQTFKEAIGINKGLMALGNVIAALSKSPNKPLPLSSKKIRNENVTPFVPYRESKLTRLLQGSLGGNHKTLMIACISSLPDDFEETVTCLRFANRAKNIQNKITTSTVLGTCPDNDQVNQLIHQKNQQLSQYVSSLQQQLQGIASELLQVLDGDISFPKKYTKEVLQSLLEGKKILTEDGPVSLDIDDDGVPMSVSTTTAISLASRRIGMFADSPNVTCCNTSLPDSPTIEALTRFPRLIDNAYRLRDSYKNTSASWNDSSPSTASDTAPIMPTSSLINNVDSTTQFSSLLDLYLTLFSPRFASIQVGSSISNNTSCTSTGTFVAQSLLYSSTFQQLEHIRFSRIIVKRQNL